VRKSDFIYEDLLCYIYLLISSFFLHETLELSGNAYFNLSFLPYYSLAPSAQLIFKLIIAENAFNIRYPIFVNKITVALKDSVSLFNLLRLFHVVSLDDTAFVKK
jgi:hypothetical protein